MSGLVDFVGLPEPEDASVAGVTLAPCVGCVAALRPATIRRQPAAKGDAMFWAVIKCNLCTRPRNSTNGTIATMPPATLLTRVFGVAGGLKVDETGQPTTPVNGIL